jgi:hypothetical protein
MFGYYRDKINLIEEKHPEVNNQRESLKEFVLMTDSMLDDVNR